MTLNEYVILAKLRVEIDVRSGLGMFSLPDLGFP